MTTLPNRYGVEQARLEFVFNRDGLEGALTFAEQTMRIYRKCFFVQPNGRKMYVHQKEYRRNFIEGYLAFKRFCFDYNRLPKETK